MKQEEVEQDGPFCKHQNFLKLLQTRLTILNNKEWHLGRLFYKKLNEGKVGFYACSFQNFGYEPLMWFIIACYIYNTVIINQYYC